MKKNYTFFVLFLLAALSGYSQEYRRMINQGTYTLQEIQEAAEEHFAIVGKGRGVGYKSYKRWEYNAMLSADNDGMLKSPDYYDEVLHQYRQNQNSNFRMADFQGNWEEMGPTSWNQTSGWNPGVGRITSIASENGNHNHMIVGGPSGGVWKTTDGGSNWTVLTDNQSNLDVYALAIDPNNAQNYFWGSRSGLIYNSTDGGVTWNQLADIGNGTVNKILVDPSNSTKMYCSAQDGGIFKSTNSGATWTMIHPSATHGFDIEFKPGSNGQTIYASGNQFFKSTDGGATFNVPNSLPNWTQEYVSGSLDWSTASVNENGSVTPRTGNSMAILFIDSPSNPTTKLVSPKLELAGSVNPQLTFYFTQVNWYGDIDELHVYYKTSAGGAWTLIPGASYVNEVTNWTQITLNLPNVTDDYYIAFESRNQYGRGTTLDDVAVTTNAGTVFQDGFEGAPNQFGSGVKMMGVTNATGAEDVIYVVEADGGTFGSLHKSINGGTTFTKLDHTGKNYFGYASDASDNRGQAPRDMDITVDPNNANIVHMAGINLWRSTDGGVTFNITSQWVPGTAAGLGIGYCHADIDIIEFINDDLYVGSDGGLFVATNPNNVTSNYFTDLTDGIGMRQFYKIGVSQTNPVVVTGGAQDNGSSVFINGAWRDWLGADGMEGFVDKNNSSILYGTSQNGSLYKSFNGGLSYSGIASPDNKDGNWVTPFEQDPTVTNTIYGGYDQVYKSTNGGGTWSAISQNFGGNLNNLKIAPSNNQIMYASRGSSLYKTINGGATNWTSVTGFSGNVNSIAIHPTDPNKVAIAASGGNVFITENGGTTWTNRKHNLPNFTAYCVAWHGNADNGLYVGMNYGVFYIDDTFIADNSYWQAFSNNLPNVRVYELEVNSVDSKLYAGTYGRGLWRSDLYNPALSIAEEIYNNLSIYPNPVNDKLNFSWDKNDKATIRVFDINGKLVNYANDVSLLEGYQMNMSSLATGMYFVKITTKEASVVKKISVK